MKIIKNFFIKILKIFLLKDFYSLEYIYSRIKYYFYCNFTHKNFPWLTQDANKWLNNNLNENFLGLEFGSGRSTLWLSGKIKHLISVEHNSSWYLKVKKMIEIKNIDNVNLVKKNDTLNDYLDIFDSINDNSLDFVLIDGIHRSNCAIKSIEKLKNEGILVIDNINRYLPIIDTNSPNSIKDTSLIDQNWLTFLNLVENQKSIIFSNNITDTGIYFVKK